MIAFVTGKLIQKSPESVIIDVGGVGYGLVVPLSTYSRLPGIGGDISLNVHTHLKEDAIELYGFLTRKEKEVFLLLISVSGVGPRLAKNILSGIDVERLVTSIASGDRLTLSSIPGIGAKSAERIILELKDKALKLLPDAASPRDTLSDDVISALLNLGYKNTQAEEAVKKARGRGATPGFEELLKESLKVLARK